MRGRIALVYHYHVDATVLSSDGKGHIYSTAVTSHVTRPTYSSSGILNCITALWSSPRTFFSLSHLTFMLCSAVDCCSCVYKEGERTDCVNGCTFVSSTVWLTTTHTNTICS